MNARKDPHMSSAPKASFDIAVIVGSLRKASFSRKLASALATISPANLKLAQISIGELPFYNQDLETDKPPTPWVEFRERVRKADGLLFVTPEYNRSVPAVLKNAIDVGSRPYGKSAWEGKPGAVVSISPGAAGAFGANHHLRQSLVFLNVPAMAQPEAYLGGADKLFDANDQLVPATSEFMGKFLQAYATWVSRYCS
jgi:chromate reductase